MDILSDGPTEDILGYSFSCKFMSLTWAHHGSTILVHKDFSGTFKTRLFWSAGVTVVFFIYSSWCHIFSRLCEKLQKRSLDQINIVEPDSFSHTLITHCSEELTERTSVTACRNTDIHTIPAWTSWKITFQVSEEYSGVAPSPMGAASLRHTTSRMDFTEGRWHVCQG